MCGAWAPLVHGHYEVNDLENVCALGLEIRAEADSQRSLSMSIANFAHVHSSPVSNRSINSP